MSMNDSDFGEGEDLPSEFMKSLEADGVYLSGPIRCVDDDGRQWRNSLIEDYPEIDFNNPLDNFDPETCDILNDPIEFEENAEKEQVLPSEYVTEDKIMIQQSDAVFVGLPDEKARGTMMESMYAYGHGIPFFVWIIDDQDESGWIFDHAEVMDADREIVMNEVKECLKNNM